MDKAPSYKSWDLLALFRELFKAHFSCNAVELNPATLSGIYRKDYAAVDTFFSNGLLCCSINCGCVQNVFQLFTDISLKTDNILRIVFIFLLTQ